MDENKIAELKTKHGKILIVDLDDKVIAFKKFSKAALQDLVKNVSKKPEQALELSINAVKFVCVHGAEHLDALAEDYPLAFAGSEDEPGICEQLVSMSRGAAKFRKV